MHSGFPILTCEKCRNLVFCAVAGVIRLWGCQCLYRIGSASCLGFAAALFLTVGWPCLPWPLITATMPPPPCPARCAGSAIMAAGAWSRCSASPTDPEKDAALVVDGATGKVLYARNETAERHPASLTKMMTLYLLFDALKAGKVTMQTQMPVSWHASVQQPTKLDLRPGQTIDVDTAIRAIVIRCANDVAVVIAEALGGTESHFAEMMTEQGPPARHEGNQLPQCLGPARSAADHHGVRSGGAGAPSGL